MRTLRVATLLTVGAMVLVCPVGADDRDKQDREVSWVKQFTTEFFEAALAAESDGDYSTPATAFLGPELRAQEKENPTDALIKVVWQYRGATFRVKSANIAPNGSEVILQGEVVPPDPAKVREEDEKARGEAALLRVFQGIDVGKKQTVPADVTVRVARDTEGGRWLIRFIRVRIRANDKSK